MPLQHPQGQKAVQEGPDFVCRSGALQHHCNDRVLPATCQQVLLPGAEERPGALELFGWLADKRIVPDTPTRTRTSCRHDSGSSRDTTGSARATASRPISAVAPFP
eukprot:CAMPEP_0179376060 /NCGR_PEP_ID=MMETSP0797-20121207/88123_1 /TAXON_ID=47934 /ORGANISM="Dinophysis acuminata, Strain DAEP01" /LENGTH=105 /DNA_ID=CAMNT_0021092085 /DNA_START=64 /DNA_END=378 /DNA_ORIENTATION=+